MKKNHLINAMLLFTLAGCQQPADTPTATPSAAPTTVVATPESTESPSATETPSQSAEVDSSALLAQLEGDKFPYKETKKKENGPGYLAIASTSTDDDTIVAALKAVRETYIGKESVKSKNFAGDDYKAMILKHLASENPKVKHWAIHASGPALGDNPDPKVVEQITIFMTEGTVEGQRHDAIDVINRMKDYTKNPQVAEALFKALGDKHPAVVSEALFRLNSKSYGLQDKAKFLDKAVELASDKDPGVRGRAIEFAGSLARGSEEKVTPLFVKALKDPHPYVRSEAASALGRIKSLKSIPEMMPLVDDSEKNTYDIKFKNLLGNNDRVHHDGSAWSRVDDAVLYTIGSMTYSLKDKQFKYGKIVGKTKDQDIAREVGRVKEWFAANKGSL